MSLQTRLVSMGGHREPASLASLRRRRLRLGSWVGCGRIHEMHLDTINSRIDLLQPLDASRRLADHAGGSWGCTPRGRQIYLIIWSRSRSHWKPYALTGNILVSVHIHGNPEMDRVSVHYCVRENLWREWETRKHSQWAEAQPPAG
jgi:hypothetical protein